ncbi:type 4a pilus biogenesis protein PilO [Candidatus Kaiserbacteria bacterium]|nr:type 4a pilus biogenesis protein PilO [Candidatus Kaiserbacteria bacterium]
MTKTIFSVVALVLAGSIFFFYTKPTYDSVQGTQEEIASYNAALDKATELQQLKQQLLARYNAFSPENIDRLQKLLPDHVDNVALILDFDSVAARYGLSLENVDVSTPASGAANQGVVGGGGTRYDSLTMKFSTAGTYNNFKDFLHGIEASLRVVDLVSLSLTEQNAVTPTGEPVYRYDVILRTYWLK